MERGGGGSSSSGGSGLGEDNRCACGRTLQMVGVHVTPTTGGQFELRVAATDSIEFLRRLVSKRLRVPKERICLLYRDRHLREGTLEENSIMDGARITLLPSVETGLLTQRPEQSVMQALESLNDGQVNDFLTGKAPLNLTMRLGDHMMLIQLQLSTVSPGGSRKTRLQPTHSHTHTHAHTHNHAHTHTHTHSHTHTHAHTHSHSLDHGGAARTSAHAHALTPPYTPHATCSGYSPVHTSHLSSQSSIPASVTINPSQSASSNSTVSNSPSSPSSTSSSTSSSPSSASATLHHQHNLLHHYHHHHHHSMGCGSPSSPPPPYLATPPHHHHHHHHHHLRPTPGTPTTPTSPTSSSSGSNTSSPSGLGFDGELPVRGCPHRGEETDPRASLDTKALAEASRNLTQTLKQLSSEVLTSKPEQKEETITPHEVATASLGSLGGSSSSNSSSGNNSSSTSSGSSSINSSGSNGNGSGCSSGGGGSSNNSSSASSNSSSSSSSSSSSGSGGIKKQGAIIESMHHHGKGVYSGTFSGTLNPALQDRQGRPKRDISTIIHILNDLLCATPQYRRHSTNISLSTSTPTTSRSKNSGGIAKRGTQQNGGASTSELHMQDSATHRNSGKCADNAQAMEHDSGDENQAMRTKVEQLRLIMEQRRARRKARRDARTRPYPHTSASWATDTSVPTVVATSSTAPASTTQAMDVDGSKADGTDPATLCELNSETVVA